MFQSLTSSKKLPISCQGSGQGLGGIDVVGLGRSLGPPSQTTSNTQRPTASTKRHGSQRTTRTHATCGDIPKPDNTVVRARDDRAVVRREADRADLPHAVIPNLQGGPCQEQAHDPLYTARSPAPVPLPYLAPCTKTNGAHYLYGLALCEIMPSLPHRRAHHAFETLRKGNDKYIIDQMLQGKALCEVCMCGGVRELRFSGSALACLPTSGEAALHLQCSQSKCSLGAMWTVQQRARFPFTECYPSMMRCTMTGLENHTRRLPGSIQSRQFHVTGHSHASQSRRAPIQ